MRELIGEKLRKKEGSGALKKMKGGKASAVDDIVVEMLKYEG